MSSAIVAPLVAENHRLPLASNVGFRGSGRFERVTFGVGLLVPGRLLGGCVLDERVSRRRSQPTCRQLRRRRGPMSRRGGSGLEIVTAGVGAFQRKQADRA